MEAWEQLDAFDLEAEFARRCPTLQCCPRFLRGRYRHALRIALEAMGAAHTIQDEVAEVRSWKLFALLSRMILHRSYSKGSVGRRELEERCNAFARGEWTILLDNARRCAESSQSHRRPRDPDVTIKQRREQAQSKIRLEECRKARQILTSAALAPGNQSTLDQLRQRPVDPTGELPNDVLSYEPDTPLEIDFSLFISVLKASSRGSSAGPGGMTNEHMKIVLDDEDTSALMHQAVLYLARAQVPATIAAALMSARMTALVKPNGKVRGIATGTAFRRLVASCLARIVGEDVETACSPFQYALSTRAGTECIGHLFRAACDLDESRCVLSIDGIGAFDHVRRSAMLGKLRSLPRASSILPFVRLSYAGPTKYRWTDDSGDDFEIAQAEGGEQGDPLMPLLFALGIHDALAEVASQLREGEDICAFLDDVYALCSPERVRPIYDLLSAALEAHAGIALHTGKTKVWNRAGVEPPRISDLGGEEGAWSPAGLIILGSPVGTPGFIRDHAEDRIRIEKALLKEIAVLPDPQCAWQLLTRCAVPRGNYLLRTLPPTQCEQYARDRDAALWETALAILQADALPSHLLRSGKAIAELPMRMGGLGIRSSERSRHAAYWASWADALEMIRARNPSIATEILQALQAEDPPAHGCLHEARHCAEILSREGFDACPSWPDLADGLRPPPVPDQVGADERTPGWQFIAASTRERHARRAILLSRCRSVRAMLRSQSGQGASLALMAAPTSPETTLSPEVFQSAVRRRLRWPLPLVSARCEGCGGHVDELGDHFSACMTSGRPKIRSVALEATVAQICREAGARVRQNVLVRDLNVAVLAGDERRLEVVCSGVPVMGGSQLAIDVTLRSVLTRDGEPRPRSDWDNGVIAEGARSDKANKYPELVGSARCRLVVLAVELGGRVSAETADFLRQLAAARAGSSPGYLRASAAAAFERRWARMLAVSATTSHIRSVIEEKDSFATSAVSVAREPWLQDLLSEARSDPPRGGAA